MSTINLYKIDSSKSQEFYKTLREKMEETEPIELDRSTAAETHIFSCTLYLSVPDEEKSISWNWILRTFNKESITAISSPKAVFHKVGSHFTNLLLCLTEELLLIFELSFSR